MKIAWVYPRTDRCGISFYSHRYLSALRPHVDPLEIDCAEAVSAPSRTARLFNSCDLIHVQYETSLYLRHGRDRFSPIFSRVIKPIVVTLHEIYPEFPGVYPRIRLRGGFLTFPLRRILYDLRHPCPTALSRHIRKRFHARTLLVHSHWQRSVLTDKGIDESFIRIIPHPIARSPFFHARNDISTPVLLGAVGFLNPNYDYSLLMETLQKLSMPWRFVWIGGPRRDEDRDLLSRLQAEILRRGLQSRFTITGWVSEEERDRQLSGVDICLALFTTRSVSGSIATALGAGCPVIASRLPFLEEMVAEHPVLTLIEQDSDRIASEIHALCRDAPRRSRRYSRIDRYIDEVEYRTLAPRLDALYREIAAQ